jgi:hypothetical protein
MHRFVHFPCKYLGMALFVLILIYGGCGGTGRNHQANTGPSSPAEPRLHAPLSANDVSLLFPAPASAADLNNSIAVRDLSTPNVQDPAKRDPVWPTAAFQQFITIADSSFSQVVGSQNRIGLPAEARNVDAWFIAGIRIDAGAPGLSTEIRGQFGQLPQIRLIVQPVTRAADGTPKVLDIAGHLIFDFVTLTPAAPAQPGCLPRQSPDADAFNSIVIDLANLRDKLRDG